jgi:hypothetical protein
MKTRLISIALILMLSSTLAIAQSTDKGKTSFAILGGVNFQNLNGKDIAGNKLENDMIFGYHAGVNIQIPVAPEFYFQPGLLFTTKGAKNLTGTFKLSYIELPLNFVYKGLLGNGYVMVGFGPYVGYAITTKGGDFKAFDAGGNIFAGYEMAGGIFCQLNTQFGMLNIKDSSDKSSIKNTGFGLSIGYRF